MYHEERELEQSASGDDQCTKYRADAIVYLPISAPNRRVPRATARAIERWWYYQANLIYAKWVELCLPKQFWPETNLISESTERSLEWHHKSQSPSSIIRGSWDNLPEVITKITQQAKAQSKNIRLGLSMMMMGSSTYQMHWLECLSIDLPTWMRHDHTAGISACFTNVEGEWIHPTKSTDRLCEFAVSSDMLRYQNWPTELCIRAQESTSHPAYIWFKNHPMRRLHCGYNVKYNGLSLTPIIFEAEATIHVNKSGQLHLCRLSPSITIKTASFITTMIIYWLGQQSYSQRIGSNSVLAQFKVGWVWPITEILKSYIYWWHCWCQW